MKSIDLRTIGYRISQNDASAPRELYDHYNNSFYQLAIVIVQSSEMAEEIVEDVFIEAWKMRAHMRH